MPFHSCTFVQKSPVFYQMSPTFNNCFFGAGSYFESSTRQEGDVIKCRFTVEGSAVEQLTLHWGIYLFIAC